jgi:predicted amidohydrolase/peptidoglycan/xylan/chitin deacetylase (PgdA/CDA1 family)
MGQLQVEPGDREGNLARAEAMVARAAAAGCALVVLPECLDLGWAHESARTQAQPVPGPTTDRLAAAAREHGVMVAAGVTELSEDGTVHNAAVLLSATGDLLLHHRKVNELEIARHLYAHGDRLGVARTPIGVVGLDICADGFGSAGAIGRALGLLGAQLLVSPSAWAVPADHDEGREPYGDLWRDSYAALAREHRMAVVGVSNVGPVVGGAWDGRRCIGRSLAVGPDGEVLAVGPADEEALVVVDVPLRAPGRPAELPASIPGARRRGDVIELVNEPTAARTVVLTFDDGPNPPDTLALLDLLDREGVRAVFCLVGEQAARHPDVVRRIVASGHRLGAHSWRHDDLEDWGVAEVRADLERTLAAIHAAVPGVEVPFYRAPFGHWGRTIPVAGELGMRPLGWQTAVWDWDQPGTDELVRRICGVVPGGIVLLHDGGGDRRQTVEAVARVIPRLRADGWTFTVPR